MIKITLVVLILSCSHAKISYEPLPAEINSCFHKMYHNDGKQMPAETIATSCVSEYIWNHVSVRCGETPKQTLNFIGEMLLPYLGAAGRSKRSATRYRKEYRKLTEAERTTFHNALNDLKNDRSLYPNVYDAIANYHSSVVRTAAHKGPAFLGWHRIYLLIMENALRTKRPSVTIPYWDCSLDDNMNDVDSRESTMWHNNFMGEVANAYDGSNGPIQNGPISHWNIVRNLGVSVGSLFSESNIKTVMSIKSYAEFNSKVEVYHNQVHKWIGGNMNQLESAPSDPVFFLLHAFVDCLWWTWQKNNEWNTATWQYPKNITGEHAPHKNLLNIKVNRVSVTNAESIGKKWYQQIRYEPRPSCQQNTCANKYLRCIGTDTTKCASQIKQNIQSTSHQSGFFYPYYQNPYQYPFGRWKRSNLVDVHLAQPYLAPLALDIKIPNIPDLIKEHFPFAMNFKTAFHSLNDKMVTKQCFGFSIQNQFTINCKSDSNLWVYMPVKILRLRQSKTVFHSHLVSHGKIDQMSDMYNECHYRKTKDTVKPEKPLAYEKCIENNAGVFKVIITSQGLNYRGTFSEYVLLDNRQAVDGKIGYIAFKRPEKNFSSKFMLTAFDQCGRICTPKCRKSGTYPPEYVPCSGVMNIDSGKPRHYSNTYGEAVLQYWKYAQGDVCPMARDDAVDIIFFCEYKNNWYPWY